MVPARGHRSPGQCRPPRRPVRDKTGAGREPRPGPAPLKHETSAAGRAANACPLIVENIKSNLKRMKTNLAKLLSLSALGLCLTAGGQTGAPKGAASEIPAYYDHQLFTIQFVEFSANAERTLLRHNKNINLIYQSDAGLPGGQPFVSVIDAVPGDGFNPLWLEIQVNFTPGHTPRQLFSDDEIANAFEAGEITLESTGELYWCPVVGPK
jgi:hypothetical protein